jgi:hypothetical protein
MPRSTRGWLYLIARIMGDVNAVKRAGRVTGRAFADSSASFVRSCDLFGWRVTVQHIAEDCPR